MNQAIFPLVQNLGLTPFFVLRPHMGSIARIDGRNFGTCLTRKLFRKCTLSIRSTYELGKYLQTKL